MIKEIQATNKHYY